MTADDQPANSSVDGGGNRTYSNPRTGKDYKSVTTIISQGVPKPALMAWAAKLVATKAMDSPEIINHMDRQTGIDYLKKEPTRARDEAGAIGSEVHKAIEESLACGSFGTGFMPEAAGFLDAACAWGNNVQPLMEWQEVTVYSDANGYAGTLDFIGHFPGGLGLVIGDYKTSKGVYPTVGMQLAAYRYADYALIDGEVHEIPEVNGAVVVHIRPEEEGGVRCLEVPAGRDEFEAFLAAKEIADFQSRPSYNFGTLVEFGEGNGLAVQRRELLRQQVVEMSKAEKVKLAEGWPVGVPTFRSGHDHTHDELAAIEEAIKSVVSSERANQLEVDALADRVKELPIDALNAVTSEAKLAGVPNLKSGKMTSHNAMVLTDILDRYEADIAGRKSSIEGAADHEYLVPMVCAHVSEGRSDQPHLLTATQAVLAEALLCALSQGEVTHDTLMAEGHRMHLAVVDPVVANKALVKRLGSKTAVNKMAKPLAAKYALSAPKKADDVGENAELYAIVRFSLVEVEES
jgi:hypothetical protein